MKNSPFALLIVAAAIEGLTGLFAIVAPAVLTHLLFLGELSGAGLALARLAGIALVALALACWPSTDPLWSPAFALRAMLVYNGLAFAYFIYRGVAASSEVGILLWPAAVLHGIVAVLLALALLKTSQTSSKIQPDRS